VGRRSGAVVAQQY